MRTLLSWAYKAGDDNLVAFVKDQLDAKGVDVSSISPVVTGGNRLSSMMATRGCLTSLEANQVTHIRFATSGMDYYKRDCKDWTIFFQEVFLFISWYLVNFSRNNPLSVPRTLLAALECKFCTRLVPDERLSINYVPHTSAPVDGVEIQLEDPTLISKVNNQFIAMILAREARSYEIHDVGDQHDLDSRPLVASSSSINLSIFRSVDLRALAVGLVLRLPYVMHWQRLAHNGLEPPVVPHIFLTFADCILRTGRVEEACIIYGFPVSHEATKNPLILSQQIFLGVIRFCSVTNSALLSKHTDFFDHEEEVFPRRIDLFNRVFNKQIIIGSSLGNPEDRAEVAQTNLIRKAPLSYCVGFGKRVLGNLRYASTTERGHSTQPGVHIEWPLYHLARGLGKGSSAASKYCNILASPNFPKIDPTVVVSLADGCAGTLALLMHIFPNTYGVYNSLLDDLILSVAEPCEYKPSGLVGCNLSQRIPNLRRMVTGSSDITLPATQSKIVTLVKDIGSVKEILLTKDAESREDQDWRLLLSSTVSIIEKLRLPTVAVIKLILPENLVGEEGEVEITRVLKSTNWYVAKPVTSWCCNREIFVIFSANNGPTLTGTQNIKYVKEQCDAYTRATSVKSLLSLGLALSNLSHCMNISKANLEELTRRQMESLASSILYNRLRKVLQGEWEMVERDTYYTDLLKKVGRERAILELALPLYMLLHMWGCGSNKINNLFIEFKSLGMEIIHKSKCVEEDKWPLSTPYKMRLIHHPEESILDLAKRSVKKMVKSYICLSKRRGPERWLLDPRLITPRI